MSASLNFALLQDIILLLISSIACFYCYLLNKRLKGLSDLKSGVGASIVSLTHAIKETGVASQSAKQSTKGAVETLQDLIDRSETTSVKMEAELISLQKHVRAAVQLNHKLAQKVENDLPKAIIKAEGVGANLLNIVSGATDYNSSLSVGVSSGNNYLQTETEKDVLPTEDILPFDTEAFKSDLDKQVDALKEAKARLNLDELDTYKAEPENVLRMPSPHTSERDEIDVLFDNIDALVNSKGIAKKVGFLESKEYYKS